MTARQRLALAHVVFGSDPDLLCELDPHALLRAHVFLPPGRLAPAAVVARQAEQAEVDQAADGAR
eukprot:SAG22_NODE_2338_length_2691_cov_3.150463_4_plen_65_part_00